MLMGVELLRDEVKSDHGISMLNMMESNTRRGADIVQQVLMFAKGGESQRMLLQPGHLVKEMGKIIRETFPKSIEVKVDVQKNHWLVSGDATQLHQVLLNLTVNARDAMPQGGTLSLVLEDAFLNWGAVKFISGAKPGPYVILKVADTGTGIPPEVADKIFDPFFTTKGTGKGTGLGLSTVLGIVRSHGGFIQFNSQAGRGTEFKIYLPAKTGRAAAAAPSSLSHPALPQGCGERILIVDDEEAVRTITKEILESNGYQTLTANNGIEAIAAFSENKGQISLVLTDLNMPFMGGLETIAELRRLEPHVAIAIMTGTDIPQQSENSRQAGQHVKLKKPFNAALLLHAVAKALAGKQKNKTAPSS
jgi:CheY-like chemotaxis protein